MAQTKDKTTQHICPDCDFGPFTRNHYFDGKLLVARDFTDEQQWQIEKFLHHHQRLHGWGVVCGLKVKEHENPECRDRYVYIEPGSAIDCCGHEILVWEEVRLDLTEFEAIKTLREEEDCDPHALQICLRHNELPVEEIPVLYDDCSYDDNRCAPNRIQESYMLDVIIDPEETQDPLHQPRLTREHTIALAHASHVALHNDSHRLYVLTRDAQTSTLYQVSTDNHAIVDSHEFPAMAIALDVSNDGQYVYVVTEPHRGCATDDRHLFVLETTTLTKVCGPIALPDSEDSAVYLAVAPEPDNRLFILVAKPGTIQVWDADLHRLTEPAHECSVDLDLGDNLMDLVIDSQGAYAYTADPANHQIHVLDIAAMSQGDSITVLPADAAPSALAVVSSTGADLLAVADYTNKRIYLVGLAPSPRLFGSVDFNNNPVDLVASPGGHWVYVLERDEQDESWSYVRPVNVHRLQRGRAVEPGQAIKVGRAAQEIAISKSGRRLYVPYLGDLDQPTAGGVAIIDVAEQACEEILWRDLDGCPACDTGDCVVLATIDHYHIGDRIEDQTDPPTTPEEDMHNAIARIDNRKGRRLLPSTQAIADSLACVLEQGPGGSGQQGPPGPPGPKGERGPIGLGLNPDLPKILDIEWTHGGTHPFDADLEESCRYDPADDLQKQVHNQDKAPLLTVYFNEKMDMDTINRQTFRVSIEYPLVLSGGFTGLYNIFKIDLYGHLVYLTGSLKTPHTGEYAEWAVAFIPDPAFFNIAPNLLRDAWLGQDQDPKLDLPSLHIVLKGDFIWMVCGPEGFDEGDVLDADNIGGQVGLNRTRGGIIRGGKNPSGDLVQGGNFESWFFLEPPASQPQLDPAYNKTRDALRTMIGLAGSAAGPSPGKVDINQASRDDLMMVTGIGPSTADRIIAERKKRPFEDEADLHTRLQLTPKNWDLMRSEITIRP